MLCKLLLPVLKFVAVTIPVNWALLFASKVILLAVVLIPMVVMPAVLPSR